MGSLSHKLRAAGGNATDELEVAQDIWFDNWEKGMELWELARHYQHTDTTIALLWFDGDDLPEVEIDRFGPSQLNEQTPPRYCCSKLLHNQLG